MEEGRSPSLVPGLGCPGWWCGYRQPLAAHSLQAVPIPGQGIRIKIEPYNAGSVVQDSALSLTQNVV